MARPPANEPTPAELEILGILWESGSLSLSRLCERLRANRPVATTTVATVLMVMLKKGFVTRTRVDRGSLWTAGISRRRAARGMVSSLVARLFAGSTQSLVAHLIDEGELTAAERRELLTLLRRGRKEPK